MRHRLAIPVAVVLALAACGNGNQEDTASNTTTTTPSAPSTDEPASTDDLIVYVAMGDSGNFTPDRQTGAIFQYAEMLSEDFDADVDLRNLTKGGQHSSEVLEKLRTNERWRADLGEADAVTLSIPIAVWIEPFKTAGGWQGRDPADCGGPDHTQCLEDALDAYIADTDAILAELAAICDPDDVMIRMWNMYMISIGHKIAVGALDTINPFWQAAVEHLEETAASYDIPVANTYEAFNGPDGTDDPYLTGLIEEDQLHPSAEGATLIAELLHDVGSN